MTFKFKLIIFSGHSCSLPTVQKHKHELGDRLKTVPGSECVSWDSGLPGVCFPPVMGVDITATFPELQIHLPNGMKVKKKKKTALKPKWWGERGWAHWEKRSEKKTRKKGLREMGARSGGQKGETLVKGNIKWHRGLWDTLALIPPQLQPDLHLLAGCAGWTACSPSSPFTCAPLTVIKTVQSGLQIPSRRNAPVTRGNLPNDQKEGPRMNHIGPDNHKIFIDVYLRAQRC